jgi:hypothetical protein
MGICSGHLEDEIICCSLSTAWRRTKCELAHRPHLDSLQEAFEPENLAFTYEDSWNGLFICHQQHGNPIIGKQNIASGGHSSYVARGIVEMRTVF